MAKTKYRSDSRVISKKDDISLKESLKLINHMRLTEDDTGLIIPKDLVEERRKICGLCGEPFDKKETMMYFDEKFHKSCVHDCVKGLKK